MVRGGGHLAQFRHFANTIFGSMRIAIVSLDRLSSRKTRIVVTGIVIRSEGAPSPHSGCDISPYG